jgi:hypothetical protein
MSEMFQARFTLIRTHTVLVYASVKHRVANVRCDLNAILRRRCSGSVTLVEATCDQTSRATAPTDRGGGSTRLIAKFSGVETAGRGGLPAVNICGYNPPTGHVARVAPLYRCHYTIEGYHSNESSILNASHECYVVGTAERAVVCFSASTHHSITRRAGNEYGSS